MSRSNRSLYVRNVPDDARAEEMRSIFGKYGQVRDVYVPMDYYTRRPRGFAYIEFEDINDAEDALRSLDRFQYRGRDLEVEFAQGDRKTPHEMRHKYGPGAARSPSPRYRRSRRRSRSRSRSGKRSRRHRSRSRSSSRSRSRHRRSSHRNSKSKKRSHRSLSRSRSHHRRRHSSDEDRRKSRSRSESGGGGSGRRDDDAQSEEATNGGAEVYASE